MWLNTYGKDYIFEKREQPMYDVGDYVHISKLKTAFTKGYTSNYHTDVYQIKEIKNTVPYVYKLIDKDNDELKGYFYNEELSKIQNDDNKIDEVLKTKQWKNSKYDLVKYKDGRENWILKKDFPSLINADSTINNDDVESNDVGADTV